jgi:hypothetical protein
MWYEQAREAAAVPKNEKFYKYRVTTRESCIEGLAKVILSHGAYSRCNIYASWTN